MNKIQSKIFIDVAVDLQDGNYNLANGYSVGQIVHFNDTGEEFLHKNDGEWVNTSGVQLWDVAPGIATETIKYGRLYNWYAATDVRGIAPVGWHVPSYAEINILLDYAGGFLVAGTKLRTHGYQYWDGTLFQTNYFDGTDDFNFSARGSGQYYNNTFSGIAELMQMLSSTLAKYDSTSYLTRSFSSHYDGLAGNTQFPKKSGTAIRLLKDNSINEGDVIIDGDTYHAVTIGTQVWLQQNLAVTHYQNGDPILSDFSGTVGAVCAYNNDESNVYDTVMSPSMIIMPVDNKKISVDAIEGLVPQNISLNKSGVNTTPPPERFRWITDKTISKVLLTDSCSNISVQIGGQMYDSTTLIGITLPALTDLIILDVEIQTGYDNANAIIIF